MGENVIRRLRRSEYSRRHSCSICKVQGHTRRKCSLRIIEADEAPRFNEEDEVPSTQVGGSPGPTVTTQGGGPQPPTLTSQVAKSRTRSGSSSTSTKEPPHSLSQPPPSNISPPTILLRPLSVSQPESTFYQPETTLSQPESTFSQPETTLSQPETTLSQPLSQPETTLSQPFSQPLSQSTPLARKAPTMPPLPLKQPKSPSNPKPKQLRKIPQSGRLRDKFHFRAIEGVIELDEQEDTTMSQPTPLPSSSQPSLPQTLSQPPPGVMVIVPPPGMESRPVDKRFTGISVGGCKRSLCSNNKNTTVNPSTSNPNFDKGGKLYVTSNNVKEAAKEVSAAKKATKKATKKAGKKE